MDIITPILIAGVVLAAMLISKHTEKTEWYDAAESLGLDYRGGGFLGDEKIAGIYRGVPVEVKTAEKGSAKHAMTYTLYEFDLRDHLPPRFSLGREDAFEKLGKLVGMQDIEVGHAAFDRAFVVKSKQPEEARRMLSREYIPETVLRFFDQFEATRVENGRLRFRCAGFAAPYRLEQVLDQTVDFVEVLRGERPAVDAGGGESFENAHAVVEAELARRKKQGERSDSQSFDRPLVGPEEPESDSSPGGKFGPLGQRPKSDDDGGW